MGRKSLARHLLVPMQYRRPDQRRNRVRHDPRPVLTLFAADRDPFLRVRAGVLGDFVQPIIERLTRRVVRDVTDVERLVRSLNRAVLEAKGNDHDASASENVESFDVNNVSVITTNPRRTS